MFEEQRLYLDEAATMQASRSLESWRRTSRRLRYMIAWDKAAGQWLAHREARGLSRDQSTQPA